VKHLELWLSKRSPSPRAHVPQEAVRIDYLDSQIPFADDYLIDPDYPIDTWLIKESQVGSDKTATHKKAEKL
jgi:hypothetical protein